VQSKRSEVLFVDYMAEHLTPSGRAGIIVPEGIIFQSGTAYVKLREMLINDFLVGVISLPSGVFMPYTGVKTSILVLDRVAAKRSPSVLFSEIKHIGVSLGVKRTPSEHNDMPSVLRDYRAFYAGGELSRCSWVASREEILRNDCNLTGSRYRPTLVNGGTRLVKVADVCRITKGTSSSTTTPPGPYPLILTAADAKTSSTYQFDGPAVCVPLISSLGHGKAALHRIHFATGKFALANLLVALQPNDDSELDAKFLFHALDLKRAEIAGLMRGAANVSMKPEDLAQFAIPLPALGVQKEIVAEIEGYQKVIDGARAVLDNYRPHIPIHPDWPISAFETAPFEIIDGDRGSNYPSKEDFSTSGHCLFLNTKNVRPDGFKFDDLEFISPEKDAALRKGKLQRGDVLLTTRGTVGNTALYETSVKFEHVRINSGMLIFRPDATKLLSSYLFHFFQSENFRAQREAIISGAAQPQLPIRSLNEAKIPLPPLATQ